MSFVIHQGDALTVLRTLPEASVNCCITSPPYWGLRDYGVAGQLGLESSPSEYVDVMVDMFREVRRVLCHSGTLWLNLGDSYAGSWGAQGRQGKTGELAGRSACAERQIAAAAKKTSHAGSIPEASGLKPKDLIGIPWRVALALQADGWWLRSDIIWSKPNPMPESVTDRPTKAHEYLFLLAKSERYYYDSDAIKELSTTQDPRKPYAPGQVDQRGSGHDRGGGSLRPALQGTHGTRGHDGNGMRMPEKWNNPLGRNKRSVWTLATLPTPEAHFATFPIELPETCLKAGCPEGGTVLDPFAGAGTTGLACLKNGRNFVGIELNPAYIDIAHSRARKYYPLLVGPEVA